VGAVRAVVKTPAAAMLLLGLLAGCSNMGDDAIYNDTGRVIEVRLAPRWPWSPKAVVLRPGAHAEVFRGDEPMGNIVIAVDGCAYIYRPPLPKRAYWPASSSDSLVQYQIEPNLTAMLLPYGARQIMTVAELTKLHYSGYPTAPVSKTCPAAQEAPRSDVFAVQYCGRVERLGAWQGLARHHELE